MFGEIKWNPYQSVVLMSSSGTNYILNEHEDLCTVFYDAMLILSWKFGESKWNPRWLIMLTNSSDTNYVLNEQEDCNQYDSFAVTFEMMPFFVSCKFGESKTKSLSSYSVNSLIWH